MAANKTATRKPVVIPPVVLVIAAVLVAGLAGFWYLDRASRQPASAPPPLTGEGKTYAVHSLKISDVDMQAHESYLKQSIVEITGKIGNTGDRMVQLVEINCVFRDPYSQVVLRERVPIVSRKMGGLAPGEIKAFRLAFDNIPDGWNQGMPELVIARLDF